MIVKLSCPEWQYTSFLADKRLLRVRAELLIQRIHKEDKSRAFELLLDTRPVHGWYFGGLTPEGFPYFAGHYRGEDFLCLHDYDVYIESDNRVGHGHHSVLAAMQEFAEALRQAVRWLDRLYREPDAVSSQEMKLHKFVQVSAAAFVYFLEIHPYADGNGHMSRFMLYALLYRFGVIMRDIAIEPRPPDPSFPSLISRYRDGHREALEDFILQAIAA